MIIITMLKLTSRTETREAWHGRSSGLRAWDKVYSSTLLTLLLSRVGDSAFNYFFTVTDAPVPENWEEGDVT